MEKLQSVTFIEHNSASKSTIYFDERGGGFQELLKRRGQEYFTLVLTKNYSNLVAALSYCSDEGN